LQVAIDQIEGDEQMTQHRLVAMLAAVALALFTGTALAGGNGNGAGHGNSANAPGHQQQSSQPAGPAASPATQPAPAAAPAKHQSKQSKQSSTSPSQPATGGSNSQGVKPSNTTKHNTYAKASSDKTKQYGNGKTAGQIATQAGYGNATLHGPGNSQPHKTAACPGGHEVDVHALKHKGAKCSAVESTAATREKVKVAKVKVAKVKVAKVKVEVAKVEAKETEAAKSESHGVSESAHQHVTICHATGSSSNPFVMISPSASGVFHGHISHQGGRDIIPPFMFKGQVFSENWTAAGQAIFNNGCRAVVSSSATESSSSAQPASSSSAASGGSVSGTAQVASAPAAGNAAPTAASPASAGGVKGAVVALRPTKTKPAGGVLGTTTRLGGTIASSRLPFTGLPLWIFALAAVALIAIGFTVRRESTTNRM
jgi:hypothetical protein